MERDHGNLFVLEGIIISLILLAAAYAVSDLAAPIADATRPRAELERLVGDGVSVLLGLEDNGTKLIDLYLLEAMHCAFDATPSVDECEERRSKNLSVKFDNYLPLGAGWAVGLGNSADVREIWSSPLPRGEAVAASRSFAPEWNTTFLFTEFSCYPTATAANATLIPLDRGRTSWARYANVTIGTTETPGVAAFTPHWWNVTIPASKPDTGEVRANTTGNATFPGLTSYGLCGHNGLTTTLRTALRDVLITPTNGKVRVGQGLDITVDVSPVLAIGGVSVTSARVDVYDPLPTRSKGADTWLRTGDAVTFSPVASVMTGRWEAPPSALYGSHPALLRLTVTAGADTFEMRKAVLLDVALATGDPAIVPIDPPYRAVVTGWLADWG